MVAQIRRVLCHTNDEVDESRAASERIVDVLTTAGFELVDTYSADSPPDVIVVLGGDGFLMESLRRFDFPQEPVFGINFGTVGFLMNSHTCVGQLGQILGERQFLEMPNSLLEAEVTHRCGRSATALAFNEFVLERQTEQAVRLRVSVDGEPFNRFAGDGFVVSSSAGSTAYNLAAGGPAVHPGVQGMVLTPLYPHQAEPFHSVQFSLMLPISSRIEVEPEETQKRPMRVAADGHAFLDVARVEIYDSGRRVTLLRTPDRGFTRLLTEKFIGQHRVSAPQSEG